MKREHHLCWCEDTEIKRLRTANRELLLIDREIAREWRDALFVNSSDAFQLFVAEHRLNNRKIQLTSLIIAASLGLKNSE